MPTGSQTIRRHGRAGRRRYRRVAMAASVVGLLAAPLVGALPDRPVAADEVHFLEYTTSGAGPLGSVSFIGDSVGIGAGRFSPRLSDHLESLGWGPIRFHAVDGKRTGFPPGWPDHFNAVPMIDEWQAAGWDSDTWIVNLGANDSGFCRRDVACARASIMLVVDAIGPGHRIWWPKITRLYTYQHQADAWNTALDQIAAERPDFSTWDWPAEMQAHPDTYGSWDGTHLYPDGYRRRSAVMARAFTDAVARATKTGPDAPLPAPAGVASELVLDEPVRVLDTRRGERLPAGSIRTVDLGALAPPDATAAAVNLTAARPAGSGFLTAFACTDEPPDASSLNHGTRTRAAPAIVPVTEDRTFCVRTDAETDLIVDLQAIFVPAPADGGTRPDSLRLTPLPTPRRLVDTRVSGRSTVVAVTVPAGGSAAAVNITATRADAPGYVAAGPCGAGPAGDDDPSNVNVVPGEAIAAAAFVPLDEQGRFCLTTSVPVDVVVDLTARLEPDGQLAFVPVPPTRLLDTRTGLGGWTPVHGAGDELAVLAVPPGAEAVTGTVTVVRPSARAYLTGAPCGTATDVSTVNAPAGDVVANALTVGVADDRRVCLTASATTHTLFDVTGWWRR